MEIAAFTVAQVDEKINAAEARFKLSVRKAVFSVIGNMIKGNALVAAGPVTSDDAGYVVESWHEEVDGVLVPYVAALYHGAADAVNASLGGHVPNPDATDFLAATANRVKALAQELWELIRLALIDGLNLGETPAQLAKRVREVANVTEARALTIARTEAHAALEAGALAQLLAAGLDGKKEWRATEDDRTRPSHALADGQSVPLDGHYEVGGAFLSYPGDVTGPPGETVNCRCTQLFHISTTSDMMNGMTVDDEALIAADTPFDESKIKRDSEGKFAKKAVGKISIAPHFAEKALGGLKKVGPQTGSNPGGLYESASGKRYYVKKAKSPNHAANEVLASALYRAAGIETPQVERGKGAQGIDGLATFTAIVPGAKSDLKTKIQDPKYRKKIQEGFAVDAWLANWDVAGLVLDNVVTGEDGEPHRVDVGGTLLYRAQGAPKGAAFGDTAGEIDTLRDPGMNPQSYQLFGDMTDDEIRESVKRVASITPQAIDQAVKDAEFGKDLATKLKNRRAYLMTRFNVPEPDATPAEKKDVAGGTPFTILPKDQRGKSGDGYAAPGLWGKYGAAGVLIKAEDGQGKERFLLVQRGPQVSSNKSKWQLAGGAIDELETPEQGAAREIHEEIGAPAEYVGSMQKVGTNAVSVPIEGKQPWVYSNIAATAPKMFAPVVDGTETGDAKWFTKAGLLELKKTGALHPALAKNIDSLLALYDGEAKKKPEPVSKPQLESVVEPPSEKPTAGGSTKAGHATKTAPPGTPLKLTTSVIWPKEPYADGEIIAESPDGTEKLVWNAGTKKYVVIGDNLTAYSKKEAYTKLKDDLWAVPGQPPMAFTEPTATLNMSDDMTPFAGTIYEWMTNPFAFAGSPEKVLSEAGSLSQGGWHTLTPEQKNHVRKLVDMSATMVDDTKSQAILAKLDEWDAQNAATHGALASWIADDNVGAPFSSQQILTDAAQVSLNEWSELSPEKQQFVIDLVSMQPLPDAQTLAKKLTGWSATQEAFSDEAKNAFGLPKEEIETLLTQGTEIPDTELFIYASNLTKADFHGLTGIQAQNLMGALDDAQSADPEFTQGMMTKLMNWDDEGPDPLGGFGDAFGSGDDAVAEGVNWDQVLEGFYSGDFASGTLIAESGNNGQWQLVSGPGSATFLLKHKTPGGFVSIIDEYDPGQFATGTDLQNTLFHYSPSWIAMSSPAFTPDELSKVVENELTISNWPGVVSGKHSPGALVAQTADGQWRLVQSTSPSAYIIEKHVSDGTWFAYGNLTKSAITDEVLKTWSFSNWEIPPVPQQATYEVTTPAPVSAPAPAPIIPAATPSVVGDVSGVPASKKSGIQKYAKGIGVHWYSKPEAIWEAVKDLKANHPELSYLQILHVLDEGTKTQKSPTPHTDKIQKWLKTNSGVTKAGITYAQLQEVMGKSATSTTPLTPDADVPDVTTGGIGHLPEATKQEIYGEFKKLPSTSSAKGNPHSIFTAAKQVASDYNLSLLQVLQVLDEIRATKLKLTPGATDAKAYQNNILGWLKTPKGAAASAGLPIPKPDTPKFVNGVSSQVESFDLTDKYTYDIISTSQASTLQAAMNKKYGAPDTQAKAGMTAYTGGVYYSINSYLWGDSDSLSSSNTNVMEQAQRVMRPSTQAILLHRGTGYDGIGGAKSHADLEKMIGQTWKGDGFQSTSVGGKEAFSKSVRLEIEAPPGTLMHWTRPISHFKNENEMTLAAGQHYRIISVKKSGSKSVVRVRVVPAP